MTEIASPFDTHDLSTSSVVADALDAMFDRDGGLYGQFEEIPAIAQAGHQRRCELLEKLDVGDVTKMTVVDFGMGSWGVGSVYSKLQACKRAIGMDISPRAIAESRELVRKSAPPYAEHFETHQSDGMVIPLADEEVDLFFSGESIEHVKFPPRFLAEIYRVLRPGGQLVVTTPNRDAMLYLEKGEEYCTSPEHFWLFNYDELVEALTEYFVIEEVYGFNGSFGSHDEDREDKPEDVVTSWSREFKDRPDLATGVILRLTKKPNLRHTYEVVDLSPVQEEIVGAETYLDLEFGLKGLLLDGRDQSVHLRPPPGDGLVVRCWCHLWSGVAELTSEGSTKDLDLYAFVPGWRNLVRLAPDGRPKEVTIGYADRRNTRALANQVIYYGAFVWRRLDRAACSSEPVLRARAAAAAPRPLFQPGRGFNRFEPFVGTTVFLWFQPRAGNLSGAWPPLGGRSSWTGDEAFWIGQLKEMMLANIDAIYVHCIPNFTDQRSDFFKAYASLRASGWDVPKISPFLDPFNWWREKPIDAASESGKQAFAAAYINFFNDYFESNRDPSAADFLLRIDGKIVLATWWVCGLVNNVGQLERADVEARLQRSLSPVSPRFNDGIYMMTTALVDPDLSFSDERMVMFSGYAYAIHSIHDDVHVWHLQPGYWDQNIRTPGYLLPRAGGENYRRGWEIAVADPCLHRVYIESWNEYDESSGIYAADPDGMFVDGRMNRGADTWSASGNPYEYIDTTAWGSAQINGRPARRAHIDCGVASGGSPTKSLCVVNEGNERWERGGGYALHLLDADNATLAVVGLGATAFDIAGPQKGVARGMAVWFDLDIEPRKGREVSVSAVFCHNRRVISNCVKFVVGGAQL